jgi:hypothetical protein
MTQHHISEDLNVQLQNTSTYVSDSHAAFTLKSVKLFLCTQLVLIHVGDKVPEMEMYNEALQNGAFFPKRHNYKSHKYGC